VFKNLKIGSKVLLTVAIVAVLVVVLAILAKVSFTDIKDNMVKKIGETQLGGHKNLIKWEVETIAQAYGASLQNVASDKKLEFLRSINNPVLFLDNKSGYFFVYSSDGTNLSLPLKRSLEGKNLIHLKDKNGVEFVKELGLAAKRGGGFVKYLWPKKGEPKEEVFPKLGYAKMIPGTEWWIGTGVYIDDVEHEKELAAEEVNSMLSKYLWIGVGVVIAYTLFVILPGLTYLTRLIVKPLTQLRSIAQAAEQGDFSVEIDYVSEDEVGAVADSFRKLAINQRCQAEIARSIADGDLSVVPQAASDKDILGNALVNMVEKLNDVMSDISTASYEVDTGSKQVSSSSNSLSEGATTSAASIEEISSSMTEIESQVKASAENATQANQLSTSARDAAETGSSEMTLMLDAMNGISDSSQQIAKIIKVIDDIAFQTNLLALNAAVEAARAGSHGKGFAVVAEEVRSLAGRSAKAARETAELIDDAVKRVENGNEIAERTGEALSGIVEQVTKVTDLVGEIASASNEQAQGVSQVSIGLEQIDSVTQSNTASAEETASASEQLSAQATDLQNSIAQFKLKGDAAERVNLKSTPVERAPTRKKLPVKKATESWGGVQDNEQFISLDDNDFGKY